MLDKCCPFKLSDMLVEMASRCPGQKEDLTNVTQRLIKTLKVDDLGAACVGRALTPEEAEEARASEPAVVFYVHGELKRKWFLCCMEPVKTPTGVIHSVSVDRFESRMRISSPYWAEAGGTDPDKYMSEPDAEMLRRSPSMKDFFDHKAEC
jgi:hypothetical protein